MGENATIGREEEGSSMLTFRRMHRRCFFLTMVGGVWEVMARLSMMEGLIQATVRLASLVMMVC